VTVAAPPAPSLADVQAAAARIAAHVRRTPLLRPTPLHRPLPGACWLKLEQLQVSGSFKARGAMNALLSLDAAALGRGLVTASGGNHGLALAWAARARGARATVVLPGSSSLAKEAALRGLGAEVQRAGRVWDDARDAALALAAKDGLTFVHPFSDPHVVAGAGTLGLEVVADLPDVDTVLVGVGGGGLLAGVAVAVRGLRPGARVIGVEPVGAPTLHGSLAAGAIVAVDEIRTVAGSLAPRRTEPLVFDLARRLVERVVLVTDDDLRAAARWLWQELAIGAELGGSAAVAALLTGAYAPAPDERVVAVVCGAGLDGTGT
jgi:threonine dehydratase